MKNVRTGVIGLGNMGSRHAELIAGGEAAGAELTAVCDTDTAKLEKAKIRYGGSVEYFTDADELMASGKIDAVIIANVHYDHPTSAVSAFKNSLHVLIEKPAGVYTRQVREMNEAAAGSGKVFGIMYNMRTNPVYAKLKDLVSSGELGGIKRSNWIITDWYRPQCYYDSGGWRATWPGEGGGVLLNQCPHQLDIWQWVCGMPKTIQAFCGYGKYHDIEVEDDVTIYAEYEGGATGIFVASTGESPGTNRFEAAGDMGKIVIENNSLTFWRLRVSEREYNKTSKEPFSQPECWKCDIPLSGEYTQHKGIICNWVEAIRCNAPLLAPGSEGINGLEISNAAYLSSWLGKPVELPVDEDLFYNKLLDRIKAR